MLKNFVLCTNGSTDLNCICLSQMASFLISCIFHLLSTIANFFFSPAISVTQHKPTQDVHRHMSACYFCRCFMEHGKMWENEQIWDLLLYVCNLFQNPAKCCCSRWALVVKHGSIALFHK